MPRLRRLERREPLNGENTEDRMSSCSLLFHFFTSSCRFQSHVWPLHPSVHRPRVYYYIYGFICVSRCPPPPGGGAPPGGAPPVLQLLLPAASDSLSGILRGVFKFTGSRHHYGADGRHQFPHLFSGRLQIFLSLHLERGAEQRFPSHDFGLWGSVVRTMISCQLRRANGGPAGWSAPSRQDNGPARHPKSNHN